MIIFTILTKLLISFPVTSIRREYAKIIVTQVKRNAIVLYFLLQLVIYIIQQVIDLQS